jgi:transposase-like protein
MARPNPLADDDFAKLVAEAFAAGMSRKEMCEEFGVKDPDTITRWRRDIRVKRFAFKIIEDRILQVTRKVDGVIASRLEDASEMTIQELLAIRKEFLGGALRAQTEKADEETVNEAQDWLEKNPDARDALEALLTGGKLPGVERDSDPSAADLSV